MKEIIKTKGGFEYKVRDNKGKIKYHGKVKNGRPNTALAVISGLVGNTGAQTAFTYIAVGTGSTAFSASQTTLVAEIVGSGLSRVAATVSRVTVNQTNDTLQLTTTFSVSGSQTVQEVGIFNASSNGVMGARAVVSSLSLVSGDSFTVTYKITFS